MQFETALSKAVGEMLERFFLAEVSGAMIASVEELRQQRKRFLHPSSLSQFSPEQKERFSRFCLTDTDNFSWVSGQNLFSEKEVLLPVQSVFWRRQVDSREKVIRQPTSNGCAGHFTREEAILSGIYENVERDGFLIYWLNSIPPKVIDTESIQDEKLQELIQKLERYQFEVRFLNTTTDIGIPSVICALIDRSSEGPRVAIGGGCGWEVGKLLLEVGYKTLASFQNLRSFPSELSLEKDYIPFDKISMRQKNRLALWKNPEMFPKIEAWLSGPRQTLSEAFPHLPSFSSLSEEYAYTTDIFRKLGPGYELYVYEREHYVLETLGYHVVKVLIPELLHLYLNEIFPPLGAKRLREVPPKLGYQTAKEWNPWPHPFP